MDIECHSLKPVMVDLFSSMNKQPMSTQVAIIDALEDVVLNWLFSQNLSCMPLKKWKCGFEETCQLCGVSDWLQKIAAIFADSRYFHEIQANVTAQTDTSVDMKSDEVHDVCIEMKSEQPMLNDSIKVSNVFCISNMASDEHPVQQKSMELLPADVHVTSANLPEYVSTSTADNNLMLTDGDAANRDRAINATETGILKQPNSENGRKQTRQKSASKGKRACSRRNLKKPKSLLSDDKFDEILKAVSSNSSDDGTCSARLLPETATELSPSADQTTVSARSVQRTRSSKAPWSKQSSGRSNKQSSNTEASSSSSSSSKDNLLNGLTVCEICGAIVKCLKSHLLKHGEPKHKCRYCPFATRQLQSLRIHEHRIHTNYRPHLCETCGKSFVKSTLLKEHINEKHGSLKRERRYKCSSCNYTAYTRSILQRHEVKHAPCRRPQYRCDVCGARLMTIYSLNEHKRLSHVDDRPFPCAICGFTAKSVKRLRSHMRCHGEKSFACDLCTKKFTMRAQLVRHQLIHTGDKPFVCPYCIYRSAIVENLRKHCHAVHKVLYPPKKRDVARSEDFTIGGVSVPLGHTTVQGCSASTDSTTVTPEGCIVTSVALLPVHAVVTSSADADVGQS